MTLSNSLGSRARKRLDAGSISRLPSETLLEICSLDSDLTSTTIPPVTPTDGFRKYDRDPVGFIRDVLGGHSWSKQRQICESVRDNRQTAVHSAHGTGKSKIAARVVCWWLSSHAPGDAIAITTAPTEAQVRAILWREINREHANSGLPGGCYATHWDIDGQLVGIGRKPADLDMAAFQGLHALKLLVVVDEACGVPANIWNAAMTLITSEDNRFLAIGNPDDEATEFGKACKPGSGFKVIPISVFDSPNFTGEPIPDELRRLLVSPTWVEEKRRTWGENSPLWQAKVLGQFPEISTNALYSSSWLRQAVLADYSSDLGEVVLGVDIARFGDDNTEMVLRRGRHARIVASLHNRDLMYTCGMICRLIDEHLPERVNLDDGGLGGGVTDRLMEIMQQRIGGRARGHVCHIVGINAGSKPSEMAEEQFINKRGEMHWHLRDVLQAGDIDLDDDDDLMAQLSAIRYTYDSRGRIIPEPKDDMRKRGLPSPDRADALMLAFAPSIAGPFVVTRDAVDAIRAWA